MGVSIYQARIPAEAYAALKELAHLERISINAAIVEAVGKWVAEKQAAQRVKS